MEYVGSIGLVTEKIKFFIAEYHVLVLFMAKKHDLSGKQIPSVTCRRKTKFVPHL
jgi:hypothetical protein